ncbi:MAG: hypothetical protein HKN21_17305 [Candidatus Eisenbacteria bacterium]|uniref:Uncharacterized protein n=1 Tax=Eiseniibacteriota bacterium TaxID=2212470 RepID=A0A7Y2EB22_UNCEI|nr:hypothetical protein [Candidatus Eisenbacteria bacterium]
MVTGKWKRLSLGVLVGVMMLGLVPTAQAEAPFFYDPLGQHVLYDPEFYPLNRSAGLLSVMAQGWSVPSDSPTEGVFEQDYEQEYRLQWVASLDPRYSLLVELKGSSKDDVIGDDYFLKSEFLYQGLDAPLYLYTGVRFPEEGDFLWYGGVESLSYRISDMTGSENATMPLAFRGFAEVRTRVEGETDPVLRLMALAHTLPELGVQGLTLSFGLDSFFQENNEPTWLLEAHAEYRIFGSFLRWVLLSGYAYDIETEVQRLSVGVRAELF